MPIASSVSNTTASGILVNDLGFLVPAGTTLDTTAQFTEEEIRNSQDLLYHVVLNELVVSGSAGVYSPGDIVAFYAGANIGISSSLTVRGGGEGATQLDDPGVAEITTSGTTLSGSVEFIGEDGSTLTPVGQTITWTVDDSIARRDEMLSISGTLSDEVSRVPGGFTEVEESESSTGSTSWQQKLTLTVDTSLLTEEASDIYRLVWYYEWGQNNSSAKFDSRIQIDNTDEVSEHYFPPPNSNTNTWLPSAGHIDMTLNTGSHTFDLDYRTSKNNKTSRIRRARFSLNLLGLHDSSDAPPTLGT